jgi:hypothetical protein
MSTLPQPGRPRDFAITQEQADRLKGTALSRLLRRIGVSKPVWGTLRPVAAAALSIGLVVCSSAWHSPTRQRRSSSAPHFRPMPLRTPKPPSFRSSYQIRPSAQVAWTTARPASRCRWRWRARIRPVGT